MKRSDQAETTSGRTLFEGNVLPGHRDVRASGQTQAPYAAQEKVLIILSLLAVYLFWGMTYLAMRIGLYGFPPFLMVSIRFLLAGGILYTVLRLRGAATPSRKQWIASLCIGVLMLTVGNGGVVFAEQWVSSGLASVCVAAVPLWAALFAGLSGRWPVRMEWFGLGLGFVGVVILNLGHSVWANPQGAIALILAPMCWALGSVLSLRLPLPKGMMSSASEMLAGGSVLLLLSLGLRERAPNLAIIPSLLAVVFLVLFGSLVTFSAFNYLLRRVRPALATSNAYVNPLVAVGLGAGVAGEQLTALELVAILVTLSGVLMVSLGRVRAKA
jgi:drug/metabolite transporter (DMT)-like permease